MVQSSSYRPSAAITPPQPLSVHSLLQPIILEPTPSLGQTWMASSEGSPHSLALSPAPVMAKQFNQDILGDISHAWKHFVDSGQVWALVIGIVVGYMVRNLTAY